MLLSLSSVKLGKRNLPILLIVLYITYRLIRFISSSLFKTSDTDAVASEPLSAPAPPPPGPLNPPSVSATPNLPPRHVVSPGTPAGAPPPTQSYLRFQQLSIWTIQNATTIDAVVKRYTAFQKDARGTGWDPIVEETASKRISELMQSSSAGLSKSQKEAEEDMRVWDVLVGRKSQHAGIQQQRKLGGNGLGEGGVAAGGRYPVCLVASWEGGPLPEFARALMDSVEANRGYAHLSIFVSDPPLFLSKKKVTPGYPPTPPTPQTKAEVAEEAVREKAYAAAAKKRKIPKDGSSHWLDKTLYKHVTVSELKRIHPSYGYRGFPGFYADNLCRHFYPEFSKSQKEVSKSHDWVALMGGGDARTGNLLFPSKELEALVNVSRSNLAPPPTTVPVSEDKHPCEALEEQMRAYSLLPNRDWRKSVTALMKPHIPTIHSETINTNNCNSWAWVGDVGTMVGDMKRYLDYPLMREADLVTVSEGDLWRVYLSEVLTIHNWRKYIAPPSLSTANTTATVQRPQPPQYWKRCEHLASVEALSAYFGNLTSFTTIVGNSVSAVTTAQLQQAQTQLKMLHNLIPSCYSSGALTYPNTTSLILPWTSPNSPPTSTSTDQKSLKAASSGVSMATRYGRRLMYCLSEKSLSKCQSHLRFELQSRSQIDVDYLKSVRKWIRAKFSDTLPRPALLKGGGPEGGGRWSSLSRGHVRKYGSFKRIEEVLTEAEVYMTGEKEMPVLDTLKDLKRLQECVESVGEFGSGAMYNLEPSEAICVGSGPVALSGLDKNMKMYIQSVTSSSLNSSATVEDGKKLLKVKLLEFVKPSDLWDSAGGKVMEALVVGFLSWARAEFPWEKSVGAVTSSASVGKLGKGGAVAAVPEVNVEKPKVLTERDILLSGPVVGSTRFYSILEGSIQVQRKGKLGLHTLAGGRTNKMLNANTLLSLLPLALMASAQAPLEPPAGKVLLGAWYDRILGDTPTAINNRLAYQPLSFFQTDIDLSGKLKPMTGPNITDQFLTQLTESNTDALAYLTVYPFEGFDAITDAQLTDLANRIKRILEGGRQGIFLRYAPEMNGTWFPYGQDPAKFKASWIRVITFLRNALGADLTKRVAFIWAPNSGNGYPYPLPPPEGWSPVNTTAEGQARIRDMDTNGNGILDGLDDPYQPYYPGDQYVDWVGISIYHYGNEWPWIHNDPPQPNKFEGYLQGNVRPEWGHYPFYTWFSSPTGCNVSTGNKPFFLVETGSTYHYAYTNTTRNPDPLPDLNVPRVAVKQAWWRQFMNVDFMSRFPNIKAVCFFEFIKSEELTERDFTNFGAPPNGFPVENKEVGDAFVKDAKEMMPFILWANATTPGAGSGAKPSGTTGGATASVSGKPNSAVGKMSGKGVEGLGWMAGLLVGALGVLVF
ncbi:hypothetical protein HDV05_000584 [Chytridiales sp. JEL 0842]|nr:hypothetical protein HDV05_000584 [Chytridiales sp. JEL 0842]